jgi:hypothetical protein
MTTDYHYNKQLVFTIISLCMGLIFFPSLCLSKGSNQSLVKLSSMEIFKLSLLLQNVTIHISDDAGNREDMTKEFQSFQTKGRSFQSDEFKKKQLQDMVVRKLNQPKSIFVLADNSGVDFLHLQLRASFSPIAEGDILAIHCNITIYTGPNADIQANGKSYLIARYPPHGSPFLQAAIAAVDKLDTQQLIRNLRKFKKYVPAVVLTADSFSVEDHRQELFDFMVEQMDKLKKDLENQFSMKLDVIMDTISKIPKIAVSPATNTIKTEDFQKLQQYVLTSMANLIKIRMGICLVLESGSGFDNKIKSVKLKLPNGTSIDFPVEQNCNKSSPHAIHLKCINKNGVYIVKQDEAFLPALRILGLPWVREHFKMRTIAR